MDKQKLEANLEQAQTKRNTIFADIESLQSNEQEADKEIEGIKADLKALDKPELRHRDLVIWNDNPKCRYIALNEDGKLKWYSLTDNKFVWPIEEGDKRSTAYTIIGNLKEVFDDLAAIGEGLEGFEMGHGEDCTGDDIGGYTASGGNIVLRIGKSHFAVSPERMDEVVAKIRSLIATQKQANIKD